MLLDGVSGGQQISADPIKVAEGLYYQDNTPGTSKTHDFERKS